MDKISLNVSQDCRAIPLISKEQMIEVDRLMVEDLGIGLEVKNFFSKESVLRLF